MELAGKTALVTGSSRGIGAAIARTFAAHGALVALHGRDEEALAKVHAQILADGGQARTYLADLTSLPDIEAMRNEIFAECGALDILVANAGGSFARPALIEEIDPLEWNAAVTGNLTATFLTVRAFLPDMKKRGSGNIITLSSAAARKPYPVAPVAYAAAKAGVQIFTQDLAAQVGQFGIRANCIAPETILTERNAQRIPVRPAGGDASPAPDPAAGAARGYRRSCALSRLRALLLDHRHHPRCRWRRGPGLTDPSPPI